MASVSIPTAVAVGADAGAGAAAAAGTGAAVAGTAATFDGVAAAGAAAAATSAAGAGAGSIFTLGNIATAAGVIGTGVSAYGQHEAGVAQANQYKAKARVAALDAAQKQIVMRQNMMKAMASQNAMAGAGGIGTGGSFGANVGRQIKENQNDLMVNNANMSGQISLLDQGAANASAGGNINAAGDLLNGGYQAWKNS